MPALADTANNEVTLLGWISSASPVSVRRNVPAKATCAPFAKVLTMPAFGLNQRARRPAPTSSM